MALTKVTYVDGTTVIMAANLNDIQDEIIANGQSITALDEDKVDKVQGKSLSTNDFTDALLQKLNGIEEGATNYTPDIATDSQIDALFQ